VSLYVNGDLNLVANNITLQGSQLHTGGTLNLTATAGNLNASALQVTQTAAGYTNSAWDSAQLVGAAGVNLRAAGNSSLTTVSVQSTNGSVNIQSGGHTTIAGNYTRFTVNNQGSGGSYQDETGLWGSIINGKTGVAIGAMGGDLTVNASDIHASSGKASLQALGHIDLEAGQTHKLHQSSSSYTKRSWGGLKKKTYTTYHHREYLTNDPVTITALDIDIQAGNNLNTYGAKFSATRNLTLRAGDAINYYAVFDQQDISDTTYKKSSFAGVKYSSSTTVNSTFKLSGQPTQLQSQGDILSNSGANQLLQGTKVSYGGTATFNAGAGEKARADARIILEGIKTAATEIRTKESNYVIWQKQVNQGSNVETLALPSFTGPRVPSFSAPGGLSVQIPAGEFKSQLTSLSQQPGMGYLNTLAARKDVNWQPVKLAHEKWDYKQVGLTPAGAALLGFAVAMATGGAGAGLVGTTSTVGTAAANAAFTSLAAQASITLINNKGDIGKTLKELGSSEMVKNMIIAAGVAGVTSYTDSWGRTLTPQGNTIVIDWAKRGQAYMLNTAAKGVLTGASSGSDWWTIAALGLSGEAYQYWVGRAADARPGVDRDEPVVETLDRENGLYRMPRAMVNDVLSEGKNLGHNRLCVSLIAICHGTPISNGLNTLPGLNAFATLHDGWGEWMKQGGNWNLATNLGSMPPALLVNYGALIDQYRYINSRRK
jgi:filamentous hemagglutinin